MSKAGDEINVVIILLYIFVVSKKFNNSNIYLYQATMDTRPEDYEYEKVLRYKGDKEDHHEEVVMVDKSDFEQLSYYAHKEKERHQDKLALEKILRRSRR